MKPACCVSVLLLMVSPILQAHQPTGFSRIETRYDRVADTTTVTRDLIQSLETTGRLILQASASFQGKEPNQKTNFWLGLSLCKSGATRKTQPLFQQVTTATLVLDSGRLELPVKDYRSDFFELSQLLAERARAEIRHDYLQKLLNARQLTGKWGCVEFTFSNGTLALLKDFISRHVLAHTSADRTQSDFLVKRLGMGDESRLLMSVATAWLN